MNTSTVGAQFKSNSLAAQSLRRRFDAHRVTVASVVGPAGSGKTTMIEAVLLRQDPKTRTAVMIANLGADRQVARIAQHGIPAVPIQTDNLTAELVSESLAQLDLPELDLLLIESHGNNASPVEFDLGHHLRIGVFSAAGGHDKPVEYPFMVCESDLLVLTKCDLLPLVAFDFDVFNDDVARLKPGLEVIRISIRRNEGIDTLLKWLEFHAPLKKRGSSAPPLFQPFTKWFQE
jgi:hydrogenase nickel incorporation protein HypB